MKQLVGPGLFLLVSLAVARTVHAVPPTPSGAHPRLFMSARELAAYTTGANSNGSAAKTLVAACQHAVDKPADFAARGDFDSPIWPGTAIACAFAYKVTQNAAFLTAAIKYWNAALNDDANLGDGLGCVAGANTS